MKITNYDTFISPVSGLRNADRSILFPDIPKGYIEEGDAQGRPFLSQTLIDLRLDMIKMRQRGLTLPFNEIWIGDFQNKPVPQKRINVFNLPLLGAANFPYPSSIPLPAVPIPNPTFNPLDASDWLMSGPWLPQIFAGHPNTLNTSSETVISSSLAMTQVRVSQMMKRLDNANFIVGASTVEFFWENPLMELIPDSLKQLYGLGTNFTFTKAQSLGDLETGLLKNTVDNKKGTLSKAISGQDYVNTAEIPIGKLVVLDPLYPLEGHKLIAPTDFSTRGNYPNEFGYIVPNIITILTGIAAKFAKFAVTSLTVNSLVKSMDEGELKSAIPDVDYVIPSTFQALVTTVSVISATLSALQIAYDLFVAASTAKDIAQDTAIAANTAKDVVQDAAIVTAQTTATGAAATAVAAEATATGAAATAAAASVAATAAGLAITALQIQMLTKVSMGDVNSAVSSAINGLTLNNINTTGDIDVKNNQITNLATPTFPTSAVPLSFMQAFVAAAIAAMPPVNINLQGDIIITSTIGGISYTQFNVTRDFDVTNHKLINVKSPEIETDAVNLEFNWNLMHDEVNLIWQ